MAHKLGVVSYTFATMAGLCLISGLLVLTGGEPHNGELGTVNYYDRRYA